MKIAQPLKSTLRRLQKVRPYYSLSSSESIQNLVHRASSLTGRAISTGDFNLTASIVDRITAKVGVIDYSFTWVNFAKVEDRTVTIGDVFEGGFYLYENDVLVIVYPQPLYVRKI